VNRRFYVFNDENAVKGHIAQCKTLNDVMQLARDIQASGTNLTYFIQGAPGVYAVDCIAGEEGTWRHVFLTKQAYAEHPAVERMPAPHTWSVLEDD